MKIKNIAFFKNELEWLEELKKAHGPYNVTIISYCDFHHLADMKEPVSQKLADSVCNFLTKVFSDFSIDIDTEDRIEIENHFLKVEKPNYYTLKAYIIKKIEEVKNENNLE